MRLKFHWVRFHFNGNDFSKFILTEINACSKGATTYLEHRNERSIGAFSEADQSNWFGKMKKANFILIHAGHPETGAQSGAVGENGGQIQTTQI